MTKGKLSVTLDADLLREVDRSVGPRGRYRTRSAVIEEAVRIWAKAHRAAEARAYYENQSDDERRDELDWAEAAIDWLDELYDERP